MGIRDRAYIYLEWRTHMDNNNNQNKNGKNPKGGQNYMVLIITMIFTLLCVSAMHNPVSYTHLDVYKRQVMAAGNFSKTS